MGVRFRLDGRAVEVDDDGASLLEVIRDRLGNRSPKDGCSPQGQCGCCTVLVDGMPRVACVTPLARVGGREVTTAAGLPGEERQAWAEAFCATGASQCGFCTPGIIVRLAAMRAAGGAVDDVETALLAHLCRCTGWRTIVEAFAVVDDDHPGRDWEAASRRATLEGGTSQRVGTTVPLGGGGFADDTAPAGALVAVPDGAGGWAVGETLTEARAAAGKVQGRRATLDLSHPLDVATGEWDLTLRTTWVEPAYLELDASWCVPGGEPATPLANGGAFGAKQASAAPAAARTLADHHGRAVRVLLSREDSVRLGPKRPPVAAGVRADGTGVIRVVRTPGIARAIVSGAPQLAVEEVDVAGPPTSVAIRAAGWAEAVVLGAALRAGSGGGSRPGSRARSGRDGEAQVVAPNGSVAEASVGASGVQVRVQCGDPLDAVTLRSYCIGAAHQGLSWVWSEGIAVDGEGRPQDLTVRSLRILRARDMPPVEVEIDPGPADREPVNGSDAVFAAVAAAAWIAEGLPQDWPTRRRRTP